MRISTFHLLLLALLYISVSSQSADEADSIEDMSNTESPSIDDPTVTPFTTEPESIEGTDSSDDDDDTISATDAADEGSDESLEAEAMAAATTEASADDDLDDAADEAEVMDVTESVEDPEEEGDDSDSDSVDESLEDSTTTEVPMDVADDDTEDDASMESTAVEAEDDDLEDGSVSSDDSSDDDDDDDDTTEVPADAIAETGSAEEIDIDDGLVSDGENSGGLITGKSTKDATSNNGSLVGMFAAMGSIIGLVAILVGCGLIYCYKKGKWDGTQAALNKVVALQMSEVTVGGAEDAKLNEKTPMSKYDGVHHDDLISSDDGHNHGEDIDFLDSDRDGPENTDAIIIVD